LSENDADHFKGAFMKVLSIYRILKKIIVRSREMTVAKTLAEKKTK